MRWPLMGLITVALVACTALAVLPKQRDPAPTLLVRNQSMEVLRVYDGAGLIGSVYPGEEECIIIRRASVRVLQFRQLSGSEYSPVFEPFSVSGWSITIGNTIWLDVQSLQPAERC